MQTYALTNFLNVFTEPELDCGDIIIKPMLYLQEKSAEKSKDFIKMYNIKEL